MGNITNAEKARRAYARKRDAATGLRRLNVARMLADGATPAEIARALGAGPTTIWRDVEALKAQLQADDGALLERLQRARDVLALAQREVRDLEAQVVERFGALPAREGPE